MSKKLPLLGACLVAIGAIVLVDTAQDGSSQRPVPAAPLAPVTEGAAERLAGSLRIPTVFSGDPAVDGRAFGALHAYLRSAFPRAHRQLLRETVGEHSLLYTWQGSDPALDPILIAGHLDVVPIEEATRRSWQQDPFSGRIAGGFIWGRGAIDNKSAVLGTLEAVEMLLREGFRPARTVHLAYGHDEEVGGAAGARRIAELLEDRGVALEMVLDEGGAISEGLFPGISDPIALVGVAEKGFVTLELSTRGAGGHSSIPPRQTAVGIVSAAVARVEESQMRARLDGPTLQLFDRIGRGLPPVQRVVFANLWLTRTLVLRRLEDIPATNAMVRTTAAATMFQAGTKDNLLPGSARAVVNFRILPGDSIASVVEHVRRVIGDSRVEVEIAGRFSAEPSPVSSTESASFRTLERTILGVASDAVVAPYLVAVATDARYYAGLSRNVYRFLPLRLDAADLERVHGVDERIDIDEYEAAIRFYRRLFIESTRRHPPVRDSG